MSNLAVDATIHRNIPGSAPLALDEPARLEALLGAHILDTGRDQAFDQITQLASAIFGTPIALLSFVDESRQWFKSKVGPIQENETHRSVALCAYTILNEEVNVILDTTQDPRFADNPLVLHEPKIRFYAGAPITSKSGHRIGSLCIADVTPRSAFSQREMNLLSMLATAASDRCNSHQTHEELAELSTASENRYALVVRATHDGVWDWNLTTGTVYYSARWQHLLGLPERDISSDPDHWLDRIHQQDRTTVDTALQQHLQGRSAWFRSEHRVRHGEGSWRWVLVRGLAQVSASGKPVRIAGSLSDITREKTLDGLTGLPNRFFFLDRLSQLIARDKSTHQWQFAVLFVDIDRFKHINDRFGHQGGDYVLKTVAIRLRDLLEKVRVDNNSSVARIAGDEFVILLDGIKNSSQAYGIAQRINAAINAPMSLQGEQLMIDISIGIAMAKPELDKPESFLHNSDLAMYRAKSSRLGFPVVFDPAMEEETAARFELEDGLRNAIYLEQLKVCYQPQIDLKTGRIVGCEALVRWHHPKRGPLTPDQFIAVAEEIGLITLLDSWVLKTACRQLAHWRSLPNAAHMQMSVNVSSHSLSKRNLRAEIQATLNDHGLPAAALCLELTESILMQDLADSILLMQDLDSLGVGLHMDDFGCGYSSFKYLSELPFDTLKIDRSFLKRFPTDARVTSVVEGILALAHTLNLRVVAEGIEQEAQAAALIRMGCDVGQGYLFDQPISAEDFEAKYLAKPDSLTIEVLKNGRHLVPMTDHS
jgi:diguanylate cyclase (GGDEF)-like protein/PAS domain S-box-containing protein